jgi:hypothetical protein
MDAPGGRMWESVKTFTLAGKEEERMMTLQKAKKHSFSTFQV